MPRAKVLIQFSTNGESPVQEVERLSHILQANNVADSYFYKLVLQHTDEVKCSTYRQKLLGNQGYYLEPNIHLEGLNEVQELNKRTKNGSRKICCNWSSRTLPLWMK
jgi:hypothetical protein